MKGENVMSDRYIFVGSYVSDTLHDEFKTAAYSNGLTIKDALAVLVSQYLKERGAGAYDRLKSA